MAHAALEAKAEEPSILDLRKLSFSFDFFLLCTAESDRRTQAVADHIEEELRQDALRPLHREGETRSGWFLLDYGSVVAHIFSPEARQFYELERMWADAPHLAVSDSHSRRRSSI
jgi:ribosome-associated protein